MAFFDIKPAVGITVEAAEGYDQWYHCRSSRRL